MPEPTQRQKDTQERLHALFEELAEIIGPDGWPDEYEPGDGPTGKPRLWEWVLTCCWVDDGRQDWVTIVPAAGMLSHHVTGLLRDAERQHGNYDA